METSEALPLGAVSTEDLAELASSTGPFLTVLLNSESGIENAGPRSEQRWKTLRRDLEARGVPEDLLASVDPLVPDAHLSGDALFVVADSSGARYVAHGPAVGPTDRGWWGPLPHLATALRWRQRSIPFVVALADRTGATLYGFRHGPEDRPDVERDVKGSQDFPITKVAPGGWAQRRYQERAENNWEENAEDVASAIAGLAGSVGARLVLLAGDVRAVSLIRESWPTGFDLPVEVVPGERPWDGSGPRIPDDAQAVVDRFAADQTNAIVERFREEKGQQDLAADGTEATIAALAAAQAAVLLLHDTPAASDPDDEDEPTVWVGSDPMQLASTKDDLATLGADQPIEVPRVDALIRTAIATAAAVRFVPPETGLADGVGALLRWSA